MSSIHQEEPNPEGNCIFESLCIVGVCKHLLNGSCQNRRILMGSKIVIYENQVPWPLYSFKTPSFLCHLRKLEKYLSVNIGLF